MHVCLAMYVQLLLACICIYAYSGFHVTKVYCVTTPSGSIDRTFRYSSLMQA